MISWKNYIEANILEFRKKYNQLSKRAREIVEKNTSKFFYRLIKPCQFIVIEFVRPYQVSIIIVNNENHQDIETTVFERVKSKEYILKQLKDPKISELFDSGTSLEIEGSLKEDWHILGNWKSTFSYPKDHMLFTYNFNPRIATSQLAENMLEGVRFEIMDFERREKRKAIENTVDEIREDVEAIKENVELKEKMLESTRRLELQFVQLDSQHRKLREDLTGVRKLVGTETYGEWKILLSEIDKVNTRINALSEIKDAYDKVLAQQNQFMKQQSEVMKQQSSFINWIKYATILVPIAVISVPIIEILLRYFLVIP